MESNRFDDSAASEKVPHSALKQLPNLQVCQAKQMATPSHAWPGNLIRIESDGPACGPKLDKSHRDQTQQEEEEKKLFNPRIRQKQSSLSPTQLDCVVLFAPFYVFDTSGPMLNGGNSFAFDLDQVLRG
jgi:hypothetical protein